MGPSAEPWEDHRVPSADEQICLMVTALHRLFVFVTPSPTFAATSGSATRFTNSPRYILPQ
jgi:hypothetical protein